MERYDKCATGDLNLSSDELQRLKKAFEDPEFRKLFSEYAEEISDPKNRKKAHYVLRYRYHYIENGIIYKLIWETMKYVCEMDHISFDNIPLFYKQYIYFKYEEEIRAMELEQGMDVEFVNPLPGHCLKTRHWPDLSKPETENISLDENRESVKVFINICKSDKVGCPEMKSSKTSAKQSKGIYWSLPHCFTPPREDYDKAKKPATVYDVAFHPKAFELAYTTPSIRRLLDTTAIEGLQNQFNLKFGKTFSQALQLSKYKSPSTHLNECNQDGSSNRSDYLTAHEDSLLKAVHVLKGINYKGVPKPVVIRRRRADFNQRQADLKKREEDDLKSCETPAQREVLKKISNFTNPNAGQKSVVANESTDKYGKNTTKSNVIQTNSDGSITPYYTFTYSSDFEMSNYCESSDSNPLHPPDRLKVNIQLPGLTSSSCLDLEVTSTHLNLRSVKPIAYSLNIKLPYEVDDAQGNAKFDKSNYLLCVTIPLLKKTPLSDSQQHEKLSHNESRDPSSNDTINSDDKNQTVQNLSHIIDSKVSNNVSQIKSKQHTTRKRNRSKNNFEPVPNTQISTTVTTRDVSDEIIQEHDSNSKMSELCSEKANDDKESVDLIQDSEIKKNDLLSQSSTEKTESSDATLQANLSYIAGSENFTIPIKQVTIDQLVVSKGRRLAPVRFRQDPFSLTILLCVRNILHGSLVLSWVDSATLLNHPSTSDSLHSQQALIILIEFSSRGSGGCTMDWGIVLQCPSTLDYKSLDVCEEDMIRTDKSENSKKNTESSTKSGIPPKIVSYHFSQTNGVLILTKPIHESDLQTLKNKNSSRSIRNHAVWWKSIATGRTLTAGMQEYPFNGMELWLPNIKSGLTINNEANSSSKQFIDQLKYEKSSNKLNVLNLSEELCSIEYSTNLNKINVNSSEFSNLISITTQSNQFINTSFIPTDHNDDNDKYKLNNESNIRSRRNSTPTDVDHYNNNRPILKSILKQRSVSESSGDEVVVFDRNSIREAGLAGFRNDLVLSSDEFPTASSDENDDVYVNLYKVHHKSKSELDFYRSLSNDEKMCGHFPNYVNSDVRQNGTRSRIRSVNFSRHDQHVDYSPRDTVEALHHTLCSRRKKARRRETRSRRFMNEKSECQNTSTNDHYIRNTKRDTNYSRKFNQVLTTTSTNNSTNYDPKVDQSGDSTELITTSRTSPCKDSPQSCTQSSLAHEAIISVSSSNTTTVSASSTSTPVNITNTSMDDDSIDSNMMNTFCNSNNNDGNDTKVEHIEDCGEDNKDALLSSNVLVNPIKNSVQDTKCDTTAKEYISDSVNEKTQSAVTLNALAILELDE